MIRYSFVILNVIYLGQTHIGTFAYNIFYAHKNCHDTNILSIILYTYSYVNKKYVSIKWSKGPCKDIVLRTLKQSIHRLPSGVSCILYVRYRNIMISFHQQRKSNFSWIVYLQNLRKRKTILKYCIYTYIPTHLNCIKYK